MKGIAVHNPSSLGKSFCSLKRAAEYIAKGRAVMRQDGTLQFTIPAQAFLVRQAEETRAFDESARINRVNGMFFHNGRYPKASFPPARNVQWEKPGEKYGVGFDRRKILH
jgi:hypothetical protein